MNPVLPNFTSTCWCNAPSDADADGDVKVVDHKVDFSCHLWMCNESTLGISLFGLTNSSFCLVVSSILLLSPDEMVASGNAIVAHCGVKRA